jgi:hypothetical protein
MNTYVFKYLYEIKATKRNFPKGLNLLFNNSGIYILWIIQIIAKNGGKYL